MNKTASSPTIPADHAEATDAPRCRSCAARLDRVVVDLGASPLANAYPTAGELHRGELFFPLRVYLCERCFLVQLAEYEPPDRIFGDYAYFSSYSDTWLRHAEEYTEHATERFGVGPDTRVVEIASNDGYLLQYFKARGVPVLGIEPAANVAAVAENRGIPTVVRFFGRDLATELRAQGRAADLLIGNNVLAHVPDLNDFVAGLSILLDEDGVLTMEFPHLLRLLEETQFDTIYHEHFSYFALETVEEVFARHGLSIFDVVELPTHGGSLRIYACHAGRRTPSAPVQELRDRERAAGLRRVDTYADFEQRVQTVKLALLDFLIDAQRNGKSVAAYGAAAKGTTLLNYCGVRRDLLEFVADRSPYKHGRYLPGTGVPILPPDAVRERRPDYLLILAWNLRDEVIEQMSFVRHHGGRFVVPIPTVAVLD